MLLNERIHMVTVTKTSSSGHLKLGFMDYPVSIVDCVFTTPFTSDCFADQLPFNSNFSRMSEE